MNLLTYIPQGRAAAVTREQLCRLTGWNDRRVRREIKELVKAGYPVISFSDGAGYWYSNDLDEIARFLREADSRSRTEYLTTEKLRRMLLAARGCHTVPVRAHERHLHRRDELEGQVSL